MSKKTLVLGFAFVLLVVLFAMGVFFLGQAMGAWAT